MRFFCFAKSGIPRSFLDRFEAEFGKPAHRSPNFWEKTRSLLDANFRTLVWMPAGASIAAAILGVWVINQRLPSLPEDIGSGGVPLAVLTADPDFFEQMEMIEDLEILDSADFDQVTANEG